MSLHAALAPPWEFNRMEKTRSPHKTSLAGYHLARPNYPPRGLERKLFSDQKAALAKQAAQNPAHLAQILEQIPPEHRADFLRALADTLDKTE
jgi:hypothetical protein